MRVIRGAEGGGVPFPFSKFKENCPDFGKQSFGKFFPAGLFFRMFQIKCLSKCPYFQKPPLPWKIPGYAPAFPLYSAYYYYLHSLLPMLINAPLPTHFQLKKERKRIPTWARTQIKAVWNDSHTDTLITWFAIMTIDIYEAPIDNITFNEPSSRNF